MLPNWLSPSCLMFAKSGTVVLVGLTNIAGMATWTCNFIYDPTWYLIWYFNLERTDKSSNLPQRDDWYNGSLSSIQSLDKLVSFIASILDSKQVFRARCWFLCTSLSYCLLLVWLFLDLVQCFSYYWFIELSWVLVLFQHFLCSLKTTCNIFPRTTTSMDSMHKTLNDWLFVTFWGHSMKIHTSRLSAPLASTPAKIKASGEILGAEIW